MKTKFNNRLSYRIFIKGIKDFLRNSKEYEDDCPFMNIVDDMIVSDKVIPNNIINKVCENNCGTIFKELLTRRDKRMRGCPCYALPEEKRKYIKKRAKSHLKTAVKEYKNLYA